MPHSWLFRSLFLKKAMWKVSLNFISQSNIEVGNHNKVRNNMRSIYSLTLQYTRWLHAAVHWTYANWFAVRNRQFLKTQLNDNRSKVNPYHLLPTMKILNLLVKPRNSMQQSVVEKGHQLLLLSGNLLDCLRSFL